MTPTTPLASPTAAPIKQPSELLQFAFTPGGSSVIKDNLIRVYETRKSEYRIYGAYLTSVTAIRSAVEIIPSVGKLLLNTTTWFVDITTPRGDIITIFARDFTDVIHCIKTTIALPFFAIAGLIFPADVFGLFENMPGIQTKVEILDEKARLAGVRAKKASEEINLIATEDELAEVRKDLEETNDALTSTTAELQKVLQQIAGSKDAATVAEGLRTEVSNLTDTVARLRGEEVTVFATLGRIHSEITRLGSDLEGAKENHTTVSDSLERERIAKQAELQRINDQIKQTSEKQTAAQAEFDHLLPIVQDLTPKAAALKAEVERLEATKPGLIEQESALLAKIQSHKDELQELEAQVTAAKEKTTGELKVLRQQIADQETDLEKRKATLEQLGREQKALEEKRDALDKQCRDLEHTTLLDLNNSKETLGIEIKSLDAQKAALETEIAAKQEELLSEKDAVKAAASRVHALNKTIAELAQRETNFKVKVLPDLEHQSTTLEQRKAALAGEVSAEQQKLEGVKASHADTLRELDSATSTLEAKRAEQASLELTLKSISLALKGSPDSGSPEQTITALHEELKTLGASIAKATERDTGLKVSVTEQKIALRATMQAVESLKNDSSFLDQKVGGLKVQEAEITSHLSRLGEEIKKLEAKEKAFKEQNEAFEKQVRTSTESLDKITPHLRELEAQVRTAEDKKTATEKACKGLSEQVTAAKQERAEIEGVIIGLKINIDSMKSSLAALEVEQARLGEALPKLRVEEQALTRQIAEGKQELTQLKETLASEQKTHAAEIRTLEETRTQLSNEKNRLESEIEARNVARNALQSEFERLTASTKALMGQEATLKDNVRAAEDAQQAAIARTDQQTEANKKLRAQTLALSAKVQALTLESSTVAEANQKQAAEFQTRRAAFDEELRQEKQAAVTALEADLQAIRQRSPAKAKLQSPTRTTEPSVPLTPGGVAEDLKTAEAKLRHKLSELARTDKALKEDRAALEGIKQESTAYSAQLQAKIAAEKKELAHLTEEKEKAELVLAATMNKLDYDAMMKKHMIELAKLRH